jgi:hypothetical protein
MLISCGNGQIEEADMVGRAPVFEGYDVSGMLKVAGVNAGIRWLACPVVALMLLNRSEVVWGTAMAAARGRCMERMYTWGAAKKCIVLIRV